MKNSIAFLILIFIYSASLAQNISYGPEAGLNLNFVSAKKPEPDGKIKGFPGAGFQFGGFADYLFTEEFSFHPQLVFSYQSVAAEPYPDNKVNGHIFYLKIPLDVFYHSSLADGKIFFGMGPFVAVALGGSYKLKFTGSNESIPISFGNDSLQNDVKRLDAGIQFIAGYHLNDQIALSLNFDLGIPDVSSADNVKAHSRSIGISGAYIFKTKK
ncbi:MAG: porin family protein [Chitinophagales bacterium]